MAKRFRPTRYSINLYYAPDAKYERNDIIRNFAGGLNIYDLPYNIATNESPSMQNLNWHDGVLCSRDGQQYVNTSKQGSTAYNCNSLLYYGNVFFHIQHRIYRMDPVNDPGTMVDMGVRVPEGRGTFFTYAYGESEFLLYKNKGGFIKIDYDLDTNTFTASNIVEDAYVPLILKNSNPAAPGTGDQYEPENRLSPKKRIQYTADNVTQDYYIPGVDATDTEAVKPKVLEVYVDGVLQVKGAHADYTYDANAGRIHFNTAPSNHNNLAVNNVEVLYSLKNEAAYNAIMNCKYGMAFGGTVSLCIMLAGCPQQPNAVFWNANNEVAMDPSYWPMTTYNLCGDADDPVTGFGKQQQMCVVFKKNSIGRMTYDTQSVDGISYPAFNYANINAETGCDLPWTIRLCNNNLVFCNTELGVHYLKNSTAAYENNVECISQKVNGGDHGGNVGLLNRVRNRTKGFADKVCSITDGRRYMVCIPGGYVYEWDYELSNWEKPTWFYHTNIHAKAFFKTIDKEAKLWHIDEQSRVTEFIRNYSDYGEAIPKEYQFPYLSLGGYDRLKNIMSVLLVTRYDRQQDIMIDWQCDYCTETERNNIITGAGISMVPRDLTHRDWSNGSASDFAHVVRRRPGFKHVKHFSMRLYDEKAGDDMAIISAQIFYTYQGRLR